MPTRKPMNILVIMIMIMRNGSLVLHALLVARDRQPVQVEQTNQEYSNKGAVQTGQAKLGQLA